MTKKLCMIGCFETSIYTIEKLEKSGFKIDTIVTLDKKKAKKFKVSNYFDFTNFAKSKNIKIYFVKNYNLLSEEDRIFFFKNKFDIAFIGGWNRLVPNNILQLIKIGVIGFHASPSRLPQGRGRSPMNWSIIKNKKKLILHMFYLALGADNGKIIDTLIFKINPWDDIRSIYLKYQFATTKLLLKYLNKIKLDKFIKTTKQKGRATYFKKRSYEDGLIDFQKYDSIKIYNLVRATTYPYPGAFFYLNKKKIIVWDLIPFDNNLLDISKKKPGEVVYNLYNDILIKCKNGLVLLLKWEFE